MQRVHFTFLAQSPGAAAALVDIFGWSWRSELKTATIGTWSRQRLVASAAGGQVKARSVGLKDALLIVPC